MKTKRLFYSLVLLIILFTSIGCTTIITPSCTHESTTWIIDKEPTCEQEGLKHEECDKCKKTLSEEIIEPLGHNYEDGVCTRCGDIEIKTPLLFELNSDKTGYIVTRVIDKNITEVVIPSEYNELPVVEIGDNAFSNCSSLMSIELSSSIRIIGKGAFSGCSSLIIIVIPNSVIIIGEEAFAKCISLTIYCEIVSQPSGWNTNWNAGCDVEWDYKECTHESVTWIIDKEPTCELEGLKHEECDKCKKTLSEEIINPLGHDYEDGTCTRCGDIEIKAPLLFELNSDKTGYIVTGVADKSITEVVIPSEYNELPVVEIGDNAFDECSSLTSIEIPNSVTCIGKRAFSECVRLESIVIPNSVTSIGDLAFCSCSSLTSIEIPNGVTSIGWYAFSRCSSLTSIEIPNSITSIGEDAFSYCSSLTSIVIPDSVTTIGRLAFSRCSSLTSIEIPNSVTSIGGSAFSYCSNLISILISNSVTSIGDSAFSRCSNLTSIEIPNSVTSIENGAFHGCSSLTSILIPNSVTYVGYGAFSFCSSLETIVVDENNKVYDSRENCNAIIETSTNTLIAGCKNTIIPNSITSVGEDAFSGCSSLTSIEIPNSVTSIGDYAFDGCSSLTSIELPNSVTSIGGGAFRGCSSLETIVVDKSNKVYDSRENCNAIIETYTNTLIAGCKNTIIPNSVTSIGYCAFYGCSSLTCIEIPNSVTSVGNFALWGCSSLTSIEIPNSVTNIGDSAFALCSGLTIYCEALSQPSGWNSSWNYSNCPVVWGYKK